MNRRAAQEKKLYVMYDQMYSLLTYGKIVHYNPVSLNPGCALIPFLSMPSVRCLLQPVYALAGRWVLSEIIEKMKVIYDPSRVHGRLWRNKRRWRAILQQHDNIDAYLAHFKNELEIRLQWSL